MSKEEQIDMEGFEDHGIDASKVVEDKLILKGSKENGVDYTHFYFLVKEHQNELERSLDDENSSPMDTLELFWSFFYPYLEAEIEDKNLVVAKMKESNKDADDTVKMSAEMKFAYDNALDFIASNRQSSRFKMFLNKRKVELEKRIKKNFEDGTIK